MRKSEFIYKLGRRIAQLRKEKKLSQEAFAELTGISEKTISNIENGSVNPSVKILEIIAEHLNVNISSLFCEAENLRIDLNPTIEEIIKLLKKESLASQKAALRQIEILFSVRK